MSVEPGKGKRISKSLRKPSGMKKDSYLSTKVRIVGKKMPRDQISNVSFSSRG